MQRQDVYVTGIGAVAPQVSNAEQLFRHIGDGKSCLRTAPRFAQLGFPNAAAGFIDGQQWQDIADQFPGAVDGQSRDGQPRQVVVADYTAQQAIRSAGLDPDAFGEAATGLFVGSNKYSADLPDLKRLAECLDESGRADLDQYLACHDGSASPFARRVDQQTFHLATTLGIQNHISTHSDACAAGTVAIGSAYRAIQRGDIDLAICGAVEMMTDEVTYFMFNGLGALCRQATLAPEQQSRPFMKDRCGFVLSEGAAFLILESRRHVERRQANPLGRVLGYANYCEAEKMTASSPDGRKYARCMQAAIADAGLRSADITHVNTHGTSTQVNDRCEAHALKTVFDATLGAMTFTANKSAVGHSLASSGAIEAVLSMLSLREGMLLPTLNYDESDAEFPELQFLSRSQRQQPNVVLSNSFGFGGINSAIVLGRA